MRILIAEDDPWYRELLKHSLELNPEHVVKAVSTGSEALESISFIPDVITLDYNMPDISGRKLFQLFKEKLPNAKIIFISGQENITIALDLFKQGAYDYLPKNTETKERLLQAVRNIAETLSLKAELALLRQEISKDFTNKLIGKSPEIKAIHQLINKAVIDNRINVSITGESGTGKELVAKAIHYDSARKNEPFIAINVSAIPNELIESELFGYEKGAFTGAEKRRIGKFEEAGNGTIFLDELGEMNLLMQSKLLRALQEREFSRLGGNEQIEIKCRIIVATHKNLSDEIKKGNFRQDLYYRMMGLPISLPSLRNRKTDIILLAEHFLNQGNKNKLILSSDAKKKLLDYNYPGNVRELQSLIELARVLSDTDTIEATHIRLPEIENLANFFDQGMSLKEYTDNIILHHLHKYNNNVIRAANALQIGKSTIYRMLKEKDHERDNIY